jgi:hypothetical protein
MDFQLFWSRVVRAGKLDAQLYEEVEADRGALGQAALVVVLASLAAGIGGAVEGGVLGLLGITAMALVSWVVWAVLAYFIGTRLLPEPQTHADTGEMLRTLGFASAPGMIRILGVIPGLMMIVHAIAAIWMLVAMVIAVRQALDYSSTWRAVGVVIIGFIVQLVVLSLVLAVTGIGTPP